ncbi:hypothetical protein V6N13_047817 [Hibiscus sabdariffa]
MTSSRKDRDQVVRTIELRGLPFKGIAVASEFRLDLCYQQWHQHSTASSSSAFPLPFVELFLSIRLFLHINTAADIVKARNENQ